MAFESARARGIELHDASNRAIWLERRKRDVTASVAGALFGDGVHEYTTRLELWALKSGRLQRDPEETPQMRRGRLLEPVAIDLLREIRPKWIIDRCSTYFRDAKARIGATPDAFVIDPDRPGFGVLQIKSVEQSAYERKWITRGDDGEPDVIAPPLWIAVQSLVETRLTGASWTCVGPLRVGFGIDIEPIDIPMTRLEQLWARLAGETDEFWRQVDAGEMPPADYDRDAATILGIYADEHGGEIDLSDDERISDLLSRRAALDDLVRAGTEAGKARRAVDAEIIHRLGNNAAGRLRDGRVVVARTKRRPAFHMPATSSRQISVKAPRRARATSIAFGDVF